MSSELPLPLPCLDCLICGTSMSLRPPLEGRPAKLAGTYDECVRRCTACRVGFSNARTTPPLIYSDPVCNVPFEVRLGALETLRKAINIRNRENKIRKFGFSTSEDAVTWTVFSFLGKHRPDALASLVQTVFGLQSYDPVSVLLWGVPITTPARGDSPLMILTSSWDGLPVQDHANRLLPGRRPRRLLVDRHDKSLAVASHIPGVQPSDFK
jgi:hypothetical protein